MLSVTNIAISIISGCISGVLASLLISVFYMLRRPRLIISDSIAVNEKGEYRIKFVNLSRYALSDVRIQLQRITSSFGIDGEVLNTVNVNIQNPYIEYVDKFSASKRKSTYAVRVGLVKNLEQIWTEDEHTYLQVNIFCADGFGNSKGIYTKRYLKKNLVIKNGEFKTGKSLEIIN